MTVLFSHKSYAQITRGDHVPNRNEMVGVTSLNISLHRFLASNKARWGIIHDPDPGTNIAMLCVCL